MKFLRKLRAFFRREKLDAEMAEEMRLHLELQTERNVAAGMSPDEARYAALRQFGNVASIQEQAREGRGWVWLEQLRQDLRYALRQLGRNRGFTVTVVFILSLGIGANTAMFSLVDVLLFRPLPIRNPGGLVGVTFLSREGHAMGLNISAPYLHAYRMQNRSFSDFVGYATIGSELRAGETVTDSALGQVVSGNYFQALGVVPALGRAIAPSDDEVEGRNSVAVISYDCWQTHFGGDPEVVGKTLHVNRQALTVIGVAPSGFYGLSSFRPATFWIPVAMERAVGAHTVYAMVGRLAPGITASQAITELDAITEQLHENHRRRAPVGYERYGVMPAGFRVALAPAAFGSLGPQWGGQSHVSMMAALFSGAVALVLLVVCANTANLLLLRALARRREIAVRLTLGATRIRLVRQLLVESLVLSLVAAALGLLLARWSVEGLMALRPANLSQMFVDTRLDGRVLAFTAGLATFTSMLFGLMPALQALRFDLHATLKQETPAASVGHRRFGMGNLLVFAQVAVGLVLLLGAGLCLRSFAKLVTLDPGFETRGVLTARFALPREKYPPATARVLVPQLLDELAAIPGVRGVSVTNHMVPLNGNFMRRGIDDLEGYAKAPGENLQFGVAAAGPGYFGLLGTPVVQGREFNRDDVHGRPEVVLVNESFVRRYWPGQNPLGKHIEKAEVIGVVADSRSVKLWETAEPQIYPALLQGDLGAFTLLVKTEGDPTLFAPQLRQELTRLDPTLKPARIETLHGIWSESLAGQRMVLVLLTVFAGFALLLAAAGLYGFVAFSVAQRTREIGIRIAIGAKRRDIIVLVLRQAMVLVGAGLAIGLMLALMASQALRSILFDLSPTDVTTYAGVSLLVAVVAAFACWLPARRAAKVDPVVALRAE